jgi:VWFA-related protein
MAVEPTPIHLILVLDEANATLSASSSTRLQIQKYLRAKGGKLDYSTTLEIFSDAGIVSAETFTQDGAALDSFLDSHPIKTHSITHFSEDQNNSFERVRIGLNALQKSVVQTAATPGRKIMIWISPGWPLLDSPTVHTGSDSRKQIYGNIARVTNELREAGITLCVVNPYGASNDIAQSFAFENYLKPVTEPLKADFSYMALQVLAVHSGGVVKVGDNEVPGVIRNILPQVIPGYELVFSAAPRDPQPNTHHHLDVQTTRKGIIIHTEEGYYTAP